MKRIIFATAAALALAGCDLKLASPDISQQQNQSQGPTPTPTPTPVLTEGSDCSAGTTGICGPGLACATATDGTHRCLPAPTPTTSPR